MKAPDRVPKPFAGAPATFERRTLLRWFGGATVLALGGDVLSACLGESIADGSAKGLPVSGKDAGVAGFPFEPGPGTDPVFDDWYVTTVDAPDIVDILAHWRLTVDGMVRKPLVLSFADLLAMKRQDQVTDFHCVEGWSVEDIPWNGVSLSAVISLAQPTRQATHAMFHGVGGIYKESLSLNVAFEPRTLLAYGAAGSTLPLVHGFPLRLVVPRLYGYKNVKYVTRIELSDGAEAGYWEPYGYSYEGEVPPENLRPDKY